MAGKRRRGKHNPTGRRESGRFVLLDFALLDSPAYRSLSCGARALLVEFNRLYNGSNNGELFMSQRKAAELLGVQTHRTAAKYLRELEDRRFIVVEQKGAFNRKTPHATTYVLTQQPRGEKPATRDFMKWKPPVEKNRRVQKSPGAGAERKPSTIHEWPSGYNFSAEEGSPLMRDGGNDSTTYNIPGEGQLPPFDGHS